jgi:TRAP-type C4-dicarboxylate transport system permease small subunit
VIPAVAPRAERAVGAAIGAAARRVAYAGGLVLCGLAVMTVASIVGRRLSGLGLGPITGDYELVATGVALAVFAFLPWCQLERGHVSVDLLVDALPARAKAAFGLFADALVALASLVILIQLWRGFGEKFPYGSEPVRAALGMGYKPFFAETTYELEIPVWIPYGVAVVLAAFFAAVCLFTVWRALNWTIAGRETPA